MENTRSRKILRWFHNHPFWSLVIVSGTIIIALGNFTDGLEKLGKFFGVKNSTVMTEIGLLALPREESLSNSSAGSSCGSDRIQIGRKYIDTLRGFSISWPAGWKSLCDADPLPGTELVFKLMVDTRYFCIFLGEFWWTRDKRITIDVHAYPNDLPSQDICLAVDQFKRKLTPPDMVYRESIFEDSNSAVLSISEDGKNCISSLFLTKSGVIRVSAPIMDESDPGFERVQSDIRKVLNSIRILKH